MWNLLYSVERTNVVESVDAWRKTSVKTEDLVLDQSCEREEVEEVGEVLPDICVAILSQTLVVEAVDLGDLARLVVATQDCDALRVSNLESY